MYAKRKQVHMSLCCSLLQVPKFLYTAQNVLQYHTSRDNVVATLVPYNHVGPNIHSQRGTCINGLFWPPIEPKTGSGFSPISSYWFIRRIAQV